MRSIILAALLFSSITLRAQIPIATARTGAIGASVTIQGVVTSGAELGVIRYMQDATAGIAAYPGTGSVPGFTPNIGDNITITGVLKDYNGLLELSPITAYAVNSTGNALPTPSVVTPNGIDEATEGSLVQVVGVQFQNGGGNFPSGANTISASGESGTMYIGTFTGIVGSLVPTTPTDVIGIASQYDSSIPETSGYQLLPRGLGDLVVNTTISLIGEVTQTNITTSSFDLNWGTYGVSSSNVRYGLTLALGSSATNSPDTTGHTVPLVGLQPATFYYAQAFSISGPDTVFSPAGLYSTASNSSGVIRVYFDQNVDHSVSSGVDAIDLGVLVDDTIGAYIDRAENTIDVAMYNVSDYLLINKLNDALARGVQIRYIAEGSNSNTALSALNAAVPVLFRTDGLGSGMHNKFLVIDADDAARAWVLGGSVNWTNGNLFDDYNNLVFFQDQSLARCYRREFEEMWGGSGAQPDNANSRFGPYKTDNTPHFFNIGGVAVQSYFSPSDHTTARIKQAIDGADQTIRAALFVFTESSIGNALVAANDRGVVVQLDCEDDVTAGSELEYVANHGVSVASHGSDGVLLHHKYSIIDEGTTSDPTVTTGSHNWTVSAETVNDENELIIHSDVVANQFYQEWHHLHSTVADVAENALDASLRVWPIPASDRLHIAFNDDTYSEAGIHIYDVTGRDVISIPRVAASLIDIDVHALCAGDYTLTCVKDGTRVQRHFIVVR